MSVYESKNKMDSTGNKAFMTKIMSDVSKKTKFSSKTRINVFMRTGILEEKVRNEGFFLGFLRYSHYLFVNLPHQSQ
jgi:hypothetical protein